ncbi:protein of unknown function [Sterolibacterium denitrificans]|uniref:Uncharacterized protein n=1 Tax=Sterolibacterium denitrificans TaxID=157592 RepID=A0A7Z7HNY3_9PROT|nr:protein of unknown function [Sterolibacterium denitrificans]
MCCVQGILLFFCNGWVGEASKDAREVAVDCRVAVFFAVMGVGLEGCAGILQLRTG